MGLPPQHPVSRYLFYTAKQKIIFQTFWPVVINWCFEKVVLVLLLVVYLWKSTRSAHLGFSIVAPIHADSIGFTDQLSTVILYFWFLSVLSSFLSFLLGVNPSNLAWVLKTAMLNSYWKMSFLCMDHMYVLHWSVLSVPVDREWMVAIQQTYVKSKSSLGPSMVHVRSTLETPGTVTAYSVSVKLI